MKVAILAGGMEIRISEESECARQRLFCEAFLGIGLIVDLWQSMR